MQEEVQGHRGEPRASGENQGRHYTNRAARACNRDDVIKLQPQSHLQSHLRSHFPLSKRERMASSGVPSSRRTRHSNPVPMGRTASKTTASVKCPVRVTRWLMGNGVSVICRGRLARRLVSHYLPVTYQNLESFAHANTSAPCNSGRHLVKIVNAAQGGVSWKSASRTATKNSGSPGNDWTPIPLFLIAS